MNRFLEKYLSLEGRMPICVGLDGDIDKLPSEYSKDINGMREFLFKVVDVTKKYARAYKPNSAFYEYLGLEGIKLLKELIDYIPKEIPVILDYKRGDIGNTSKKYAQAAFEYFDSDAVTVAPYMGEDSILPFVEFKDRFVFVLGLTSNSGSKDFERLKLSSGKFLYETVLEKIEKLNNKYKNVGAVIGATHGKELLEVRNKFKSLFFLIPGVGAQGGDLEAALESINIEKKQYGLINSSRGILYPIAKENESHIEAVERTIGELNKIMEDFYDNK